MSLRYALLMISLLYMIFWSLWYMWFVPVMRGRVALDFSPWERLKSGLWNTGMIVKQTEGVRWLRCVPGGRVVAISADATLGDTYGRLMLLLMAVGRIHQVCAGDPVWIQNMAVFLASAGLGLAVVLSLWFWDYLWLVLGVLWLAVLHAIFWHWDEDAYWRGIALLSSSADVPVAVETNLRRLRLYPLFVVRVVWGWMDFFKIIWRVVRR